jgi:hypothetical protein
MNNYYSKCHGKMPHMTQDDAAKEAARLTTKNDKLIVDYPCEYCAWWHTGSATIYHPWQLERRRVMGLDQRQERERAAA